MMRTTRVSVVITDPWELGQKTQWQWLAGHIVRVLSTKNGEMAIVKLDAPITVGPKEWNYVRVSPRHENVALDDIDRGQQVSCAVLTLCDEQGRGPEAKVSTAPPENNISFVATLRAEKTS
jgi:hypothetical protein